MKLIRFILFIFLLSNFINAATIKGSIYDFYLEPQKDVFVEVNSTPIQRVLSKSGNYSFDLDIGFYELNAEYYLDGVLKYSSKEFLDISKEGIFNLDIILFPYIIENVDYLDLEVFNEEKSYLLIFLIATIIFILILILFIKYYFILKKVEKEIKDNDLFDKVFDFIKSNNGRVFQKDIRKNFPSSEAKISLIISELEHKGFIEKIKKGRGNIIILK